MSRYVYICRAKSTYVAPLKFFRGCYQCSLACVDLFWGSISGSGSAATILTYSGRLADGAQLLERCPEFGGLRCLVFVDFCGA